MNNSASIDLQRINDLYSHLLYKLSDLKKINSIWAFWFKDTFKISQASFDKKKEAKNF